MREESKGGSVCARARRWTGRKETVCERGGVERRDDTKREGKDQEVAK